MKYGFVCLLIVLLAVSCSDSKEPEKPPGEEETSFGVVLLTTL